MTKYNEILRLHSMGISGRRIASSIGCSRNTVSKTLKRAKELDISYPFGKATTDMELERVLFPEKTPTTAHKQPNYKYIHKELAKSSVTLSLLWHEYC